MSKEPADWVLLAYRLPREPSAPRVAIWRKLRRLGVLQLVDGLVALPAAERTREQLEWIADEILEAEGEATVWLAQPASLAQDRELATRMRAVVSAGYGDLRDQAAAARGLPTAERRRAQRRLRGELRRVRLRDHHAAAGLDETRTAIESLGDAGEHVA